MITADRECPACRAALPADALFCHKCGASTPTAIDQATGEIQALERTRVAESARLATVQKAIGDTCEVRRLLGRGGFAEVYVAFDKRLKREIAVKTIRGDLVVNEMLLERFQREAEAVAKLRHPNVCPIFSVGGNHGVAYFTMPLIEGESLAATLEREGTLPLRESLRILREASLALHAAHRAGIVHRDVKPDNIMLEGPDRSVVVMDFGIAKSEGGDAKGLTGSGLLVGTPHYMSPEQAMGEHTVDARSDQYALATIGYRMLTGRAPFEGGSVQRLLFKTVTEIPPPACDISPDVPKDLSAVLSKALSKRPEDRYQSMAAFAENLAQIEQPSLDIAETEGSAPLVRSRMLWGTTTGLLALAVLIAWLQVWSGPHENGVRIWGRQAVFAGFVGLLLMGGRWARWVVLAFALSSAVWYGRSALSSTALGRWQWILWLGVFAELVLAAAMMRATSQTSARASVKWPLSDSA